jgi:Flp pilus assembly protein TadD
LLLSAPLAGAADKNLPAKKASSQDAPDQPDWRPIIQTWAQRPLESRLLLREGTLALEEGKTAAAEEKLDRATLADAANAGAWFALARVHLANSNPAFLTDLLEGSRASLRGFQDQSRLASNLLLSADLILAGSFAWILLILLLRYLPFLHHQIRALTQGQGHLEGRGVFLWIPVAAPLLLGLGVLPSLCLASLIVWFYGDRRARALVAMFLLFFSAQGFLGTFSTPLSGLRETSRSSLIERASRETPGPALQNELSRAVSRNPQDADLLFARGLLYARQARFDESARDFQRVLQLRPEDPKAVNNLANDHYFRGNYDRAVAGYQHSAALDSLQGSTHYNLAQAYIKKLFFKESGEHMQLASRAGFELGTGGVRLPTGAVYYQSPSTWDMWRMAWHDEKALLLPDFLAPWRKWLGVPPDHLHLWLVVTLALGLLLMKIFPREKLVYECANCGRLSCARCSGEHEGNVFCTACHGTARRARSEMVLSTLLRNRRRSTEFTFRSKVRLLNAWTIGAGDLYTNLRKRGVVLTLFSSACIFAMVFPSGLLNDPWRPITHASLLALPRLLGAAGLLLLYLFSRFGRSTWRSRSFHLHPASMVRLADLMDSRGEKQMRV